MNNIIGLADGRNNTTVDVDAKLGELGGDELLVVVKFIELARIDPALLKACVISGGSH